MSGLDSMAKNIQYKQIPSGATADGVTSYGSLDDGSSQTPGGNVEFTRGFLVNILIVSLCTMCGDSSRGIFFPTLWLFVESLGGNHEDQGIAVALFSAGRIFSSPVFGMIGERVGYKSVLVYSNLIVAVGCIFYMAAQTLYHLFAAQFLIGIGCGILGVTRAYVSERSPIKDRTVNLAYLTSAQYSAFTVLPLLGGYLADFGRNHKSTEPFLGFIMFDEFSVPALFIFFLSLICSLLMMFAFDESIKRVDERQAATGKDIELAGDSKGPTGSDQVPNSIDFNTVGLSTFVMNIGGMALNVSTKGTIGVYETMGSVLGISVLGWDEVQVGYTFAIFGAIGTGTLFCFRYFYRYCNDVDLMLIGIVIMIISCLLLTENESLDDTRFIIAIALMYGFGYPVGHTALLGGFAKITKKGQQGYLLGLFASAGSVARIIFPITAGYLTQMYNTSDVFVLSAIILVLSDIVSYVYRQKISAVLDAH